MRRIAIIVLLALTFSGCRVKKLEVEKAQTRTETERLKQFDSLFQSATQRFEEFSKQQQMQMLRLDLESIRDTAGKMQDFEITHEKNGQITERLKVKGAIVKGIISNETHTETSSQMIGEQSDAKIKTDLSESTISETTIKSKSKKVHSVGSHWGIYAMGAGFLILGFAIYKLRNYVSS